ncbi:hypothetical protein CQW23_13461 [Capsicum baccatum]|uniref:Leucine-rich repeat-containing N-terminal plant-type domain-containing protein n=1 Tax=Capsicum baccatum TaxID=33114 RepID=A0A2G2WVI8_CAPBA|nr:hypothetical protein CQW23_13461 [Capsicum baccatum]
MFTINPNASYFYNPTALSWNKSTDCSSWDGVHCEEITGQVVELDLCCNGLEGKFHSNSSLFQLSNLERLIPAEISHLSKLYSLRIRTVYPYGLTLEPYNFELLLKNLTQLSDLDFDSVNISSTIPLNFSSYLTSLWLRRTKLHGVLPERVFHLSNLEILHLSDNSLTGPIPSSLSGLQNLYYLYLSSNNLNGTIPSLIFSLPSLFALDLNNNSFSGKIQELNNSLVQFLILSQNNLSGQIASTVCNLKTMKLVHLGSNHLNGTIPQCLGEMSALQVLGLNNNHLSGTINTNFNSENKLIIINLFGNKLKGKVPPSLINCRYLEFLDLGNNELNDTVPSWLGGLPDLQILSLRSNKLHSPISDSRTDNLFARILVIDLSSNGFSGNLPVSLFKNFQDMKIIGENSGTRKYVADAYSDFYTNTLIVTAKGLKLELPRVLTTYMIIDLSRNGFEGHIPNAIGDLVGLCTLDLSHNGLEGFKSNMSPLMQIQAFIFSEVLVTL